MKLEMLDAYQELQAIVDELEASECAATSPKAKVNTNKEISNGDLISTAKHVRYLVTRRHQMGSLLAQIAEMKNSLTAQSEKVKVVICLKCHIERKLFANVYYRNKEIQFLYPYRTTLNSEIQLHFA